MPRPNTEEPTIKREDGDRKTYTHPAFGQIMVFRTSGGGQVCYGSDFTHDHYISIRIAKSELQRDLAREWYFSKDQYIEVVLTESQWATFVSSLNVGAGVPCTVTRIGYESVPLIPYRNSGDHYQIEASDALKAALKELTDLQAKIVVGVQGLSKSRQGEMLVAVNNAIKHLTDKLPFIAKQYAEHMEETREKAKAEIHSYAHRILYESGLAALADRTGTQVPTLRLAAPDEDEG
jgi:hypothetical protein